MRQSLLEIVVGLVLVPEAAHQTPAPARDLQGIERRLLDLRGTHRDRLEDLEEVLAAAVLTALLVVGDQSRLVPATDLPHLDPGSEFRGEVLEQESEVDPVLAHVVDRELFLAEDRFDVHDLHVEGVVLDHPLDDLDLLHRGRLDRGPVVEILDRRHPEDASVGSERIVLAARGLDVVEHLRPRDRLAAAGVRAGRGQHLDQFGPSVGLRHHLRAAAGFGVPGIGVLGDATHRPHSHHDGGRRLEAGILLRVGHRLTAGGIGILFEDGQGKDGHGERVSKVDTSTTPTASERAVVLRSGVEDVVEQGFRPRNAARQANRVVTRSEPDRTG